MKTKLLTAALLTLAMAQTAMAQDTTSSTSERSSRVSPGGLFIEPMLLASQEDSSIKTSQLPIITDDTSGNSRGYGLGLRFGGHVNEMFLVGLDARYSRMQMTDSFFDKADANVYNIAPMVGIQTPLFGIRLNGAYVVAGESNPGAASQGIDLKFKDARGWRVGAGIFVAAVSINLEYQDLTYNNTEIESFGSVPVNSQSSVDAESKGYTLSLSFPVEL